MNTIEHLHYGDKKIDLAIPVDIDIDEFSANNAVLFFAIIQEQLKKLTEKINERTFN